MSKVDSLWQQIFDDLGVLQAINTQGYFCISADTIRKYREVRLMTKFDHRSDLPKVFQKNDLTSFIADEICPPSEEAFGIKTDLPKLQADAIKSVQPLLPHLCII